MASGRRLAATVAVLVVATLVLPASTLAAAPTFAPGILTSAFPEPVSWRFTFQSESPVLRVELLRRLPGSEVTVVSLPGPGEIEERPGGQWVVAGSDEDVVPPNTPYRLRLRVVTEEGVFLGPEAMVLVEDERFAWRMRESERLRLFWHEGGTDFARRALQVGEDGLAEAEEFLGVRLESRVDIFVYADQAPFRDAIGARRPENAAGVPFASIGTFFALIRPEQIDSSWVGEVVPHELVHLVLDVAVGPGVAMPLWLNEGLAVYLSTGNRAADRGRVRDAIRDGTLVPLDGLVENFPTNAEGERSIAAYAESVSAVDFMVRTYGPQRVAALVEAFGSMGADEAFMSSFGVDTAGFGEAWLRSLGAADPTVFGPRPAPPGPVPSDWLGPPPEAGLLPTVPPTPSPPPAEPGAPTGPEDGAGLVLALVIAAMAAGAVLLFLASRRRGPA